MGKKKTELDIFMQTLYNEKWIEEAAKEGYSNFLELFNSTIKNPEFKVTKDNARFAMIYYAAFEHAYNTILTKFCDDGVTKIELIMNNLAEITAEIKKIGK